MDSRSEAAVDTNARMPAAFPAPPHNPLPVSCWTITSLIHFFSKNIMSMRKTAARMTAFSSGVAAIGNVAPKLSAFVSRPHRRHGIRRL